jgi:hypothetical protein
MIIKNDYRLLMQKVGTVGCEGGNKIELLLWLSRNDGCWQIATVFDL